MVIGFIFFSRINEKNIILDPWGKIILNMKDEVGIGFADIDLEYLKEVRKQIPCLNHKKNYLVNI